MTKLSAILFVYLQRVLPKNVLTAIVYRVTRIRIKIIKNFFIRTFVRAYNVNVEEIELAVPDDFACFNAFFIRELSEGARPIDFAETVIVSPVDGTVSAAGRISHERLFQAKGIDYSLRDLLASNTDDALNYTGGEFATIYLAPYNYHRVHAPFDGRVLSLHYVPGKLFSVNAATVARLPGLFAQNERLVCYFQTAFGPMIFIFVGAMNVGSITTPWTGEIRPRKSGVVEKLSLQHSETDLTFAKGDQIGWFNMGSTVLLLFPPDTSSELADLASGQIVRIGEKIGRTQLKQ